MEEKVKNPPEKLGFALQIGLRLLYAGLWLADRIPVWVLPAIGRCIGWCWSFVAPREMSIAIAQLYTTGVLGPEASLKDLRRTARRVFAHVGESIGEVLCAPRFVTAERVASDDDHVFHNAIAQHGAVVTLTAHYGCFELIANHCTRVGVAFSVVNRTPQYPAFAKLYYELRQARGITTLWREESRSAVKLLRRLKDGGLVALLIDQDLDLETEHFPFFGIPAATPIAMLRIALKYQLPIVTTFITRLKAGSHRIATQEIPWRHLEGKPDAEILEHIVMEYNKRVEELIRKDPSQWVWWHRRWRRQPGVPPRSTTEYLIWLEQFAPKREPDA